MTDPSSAHPRFDRAHVIVVGAGQIGRPLAARLLAMGNDVTSVSRRVPVALDPRVRHVVCDASSADALATVLTETGAKAVIVAANPETYSAKTWAAALFPLQRGVVDACRRSGARLVMLECLYMHGPLERLAPDSPMAPVSKKGVVRAALTRELADAARHGLRVVRLRAPDFYGRGLSSAYLGDDSIGKAERGEWVVLPCSPDTPHAFAHRDDVVDSLIRLALEEDVGDCEASIYVVPSLHGTPRELLTAFARAARGNAATVRFVGLPAGVVKFFGLFVPFIRELAEMSYQWIAPYLVDDSKFRRRFGALPRSLQQAVVSQPLSNAANPSTDVRG